MLQVSEMWRQSFPGASVGLLVLDQVSNPTFSEALEAQKRAVEQDLREKFVDRQSLVNNPVMCAYAGYYKKFAKTYHVQQQLESVVFKGRSIPTVAGLVEELSAREERYAAAFADITALRVALAQELADFDAPLAGVREVAFFPPMTGG